MGTTVCQSVAVPTRTGVVVDPPVVVPSWWKSLLPQHQRLSSVRMAQAWSMPTATSDQLLSAPTWCGRRKKWLPSTLSNASPQHHNVPVPRTPQLCVPPAETLRHSGAPTCTARVGLTPCLVPPDFGFTTRNCWAPVHRMMTPALKVEWWARETLASVDHASPERRWSRTCRPLACGRTLPEKVTEPPKAAVAAEVVAVTR